MPLFTSRELETLRKGMNILALKSIELDRKLMGLHPDCIHAAMVRKARNKIDKALDTSVNWKQLQDEIDYHGGI